MQRKLGDVINHPRNPSEPSSRSSEVTRPSRLGPPLQTDADSRKALTVHVHQCFHTLRLYGREPESLEHAIGAFQAALGGYTIGQVDRAFAFWLRHEREFPTPADIVSVIERGGDKPPLDRAVYTSLCRKQPELRTDDEWTYMRDYERLAMRGDT